jgi:zinc transport system substrate-binding protein
MKPKYLVVSLIAIVAIAIIGALILTNLNKTPQPTGRIKVAATIFPVADIVRNVAGDMVDVETILPAGVDAHTFEPTVADSNKLTGTKTLYSIGEGFDNWATKNAKELYGVNVIDLSKSVDLKFDVLDHVHEGAEEEEIDVENTPMDPHYWLSLDNASIMANVIAQDLSALDPANAGAYGDNLAKFQQKLVEHRETANKELEGIKTRYLATFHNAFNYFAADYNLEVVAVIEEFPGKTPSAAYLLEVGKEIEEHDLKVLFKEPQLSDEIVTALAADYNAKVYTLDDLGGVEGRNSYFELLNYNVQTIKSALQ